MIDSQAVIELAAAMIVRLLENRCPGAPAVISRTLSNQDVLHEAEIDRVSSTVLYYVLEDRPGSGNVASRLTWLFRMGCMEPYIRAVEPRRIP